LFLNQISSFLIQKINRIISIPAGRAFLGVTEKLLNPTLTYRTLGGDLIKIENPYSFMDYINASVFSDQTADLSGRRPRWQVKNDTGGRR
jgi:hypothetical protein